MTIRFRAALTLSAALSLLASAARGDDATLPVRAPRPKSARKSPPLTKEARRVADELQKKLKPGSEARLMLDAILKGRMGPNDGWFRVAKGKTRFGWNHVAKTFDKNKDKQVTQREFRGKAVDFRRLDRNGDGVLREADFTAGPPAFSASPGSMLFQMADRDGNGHITKAEFDALFDSLDSGHRGFLSLDDLKDRLRPPPRSARKRRGGGPSRSTLVLALARQELGALQPGPDLNEKAPEFSLRIANGLKKVTLSKEIGDKPVVLIFGSFT
jgi:EF hand